MTPVANVRLSFPEPALASTPGPALLPAWEPVLVIFLLVLLLSLATVLILIPIGRLAGALRTDPDAPLDERDYGRLLRPLVRARNRHLAELEQARQHVHWLSEAASSAFNGLIISDRFGRIRWVNRGFEQMSGFTLEEVRGKRPSEFLHGEKTDLAIVRRMSRQVTKCEPFSETLVNYRKDGSPYWVRVTARPLFDARGEQDGFMAVEEDASEQVLQSQRLSAAREKADRLNIRLQEALERAEHLDNRAQQSEQDRGACLSRFSHEVRTPLNAILGMSSMLLDGDLDPGEAELVRSIHQGASSLLTLLEQTIQLSGLESGEIVLQPEHVHPRRLIQEALELFAARAFAQNTEPLARVGREVPATIEADPVRLRQILHNLLSNAVKFTRQGVVEVTLELSREDPSMLHLCVRDSGPGIPDAYRPRLFRPFAEGEAVAADGKSGSGLGLSIVKHLCTLMGGRIWLESQVGVGSSFHVTFPARPVDAEASPPVLREPSPLAGMRVLLAIQHPALRQSLAALLRRWEIQPTESADPTAALSRQPAPDCVLADDHALPADAPAKLLGDLGEAIPVILAQPLGSRRPDWAESRANVSFISRPVHCESLRQALAAVAARPGQSIDPASVAEVNASAPLPTNAVNGSEAKVLLVDDNPMNLKIATLLLRRLHLHALTASDGHEALATLRNGKDFPVLLVDIQMPEMDGFELTRRIRESLPADRQPYIIAMSAGAAGATRERSLRAGMNDYLKKPLRSETLRAALAYSPLCDHMPEVPTRNGNDTAQVPGRLKKALAPDTPAAREPTRQPESA